MSHANLTNIARHLTKRGVNKPDADFALGCIRDATYSNHYFATGKARKIYSRVTDAGKIKTLAATFDVLLPDAPEVNQHQQARITAKWTTRQGRTFCRVRVAPI